MKSESKLLFRAKCFFYNYLIYAFPKWVPGKNEINRMETKIYSRSRAPLALPRLLSSRFARQPLPATLSPRKAKFQKIPTHCFSYRGICYRHRRREIRNQLWLMLFYNIKLCAAINEIKDSIWLQDNMSSWSNRFKKQLAVQQQIFSIGDNRWCSLCF